MGLTADLPVRTHAAPPPIALPSKVVVGQPARIDGSQSSDPDSSVSEWEWDLDGDGSFERIGPSVTATFGSWGTRRIALRVTDDWGASSLTTASVMPPPTGGGPLRAAIR